jgi:hypothetical protein
MNDAYFQRTLHFAKNQATMQVAWFFKPKNLVFRDLANLILLVPLLLTASSMAY